MPLYEYRCKQCGHRFERIQTYSAEDAKQCPVCQGEVERLISIPSRAHFKGSGFYSTDYGAKPASSGKSTDGGGGSDSNSTASDKGGTDKGSAEKAPAPKTESAASPAAPGTSSKSE
jgi:putative FmdB family regulatory protein